MTFQVYTNHRGKARKQCERDNDRWTDEHASDKGNGKEDFGAHHCDGHSRSRASRSDLVRLDDRDERFRIPKLRESRSGKDESNGELEGENEGGHGSLFRHRNWEIGDEIHARPQ